MKQEGHCSLYIKKYKERELVIPTNMQYFISITQGLDLHLDVRISLALQHPLNVPRVLHDPLIHLVGARGLTRAKELDALGLRHV
jgi:hypothetical protein